MAFDPSTAVEEFDPSTATEELEFDPSTAVDSTPGVAKDTIHRIGGGLTTGLLKSGAGVARWSEMLLSADQVLAERVGLTGAAEVAGAIKSEFGGIADTLEKKAGEVQAYSEANRDRSRDANFGSQLAEAAGNFAGQIGVTAMGKVPGIVSNVGQMFQQEYAAAKENGADTNTAYMAGIANLPAAFLDYFAESKIGLSLLPQGARTAKGVVTKLLANAGIEGATEVLQDEYSNWLAGNAIKYDEIRSIEERFSAANLPETGKQIATTFAIGGILGGAATATFEGIAPTDKKDIGVQLTDLQKELDLIQSTPDQQFNEAQTQTPPEIPGTATTESSPDVQPNLAEATGDTPTTSLPEISRVRAAADPVFAGHVANVDKLNGQDKIDYIAKNGLDPIDFGLEETSAQPTIENVPRGTEEVSAPVTTPEASSAPISQPESVTPVPVSPKLQAKVGVLDRAKTAITQGWVNAPEIVVVPRAEDMPTEAITEEDRAKFSRGDIDGLYARDGKVYLIADKLPSVQRVKEVILHEAKGHFGLKGLFGDDTTGYNQAMRSAWTEFQARPALLETIVKRGKFNSFEHLKETYHHIDLNTPEGRGAMAEELLARAAEIYLDPAKPRPTWFNSIVSKIKIALQKVMPSMKLTDEDIVGLLSSSQRKLLDRSSEAVETGAPPPIAMEEGTGGMQGLEASLFSMSPADENHIKEGIELHKQFQELMSGFKGTVTQEEYMSDPNKGLRKMDRELDKARLEALRKLPQDRLNAYRDYLNEKRKAEFQKMSQQELSELDPSEKIPTEFKPYSDKELANLLAKVGQTIDSTEPSPSLSGKEAPAVHIGDQEFDGMKIPYFNLTEDIEGHPAKSTVTANTLIDAGYSAPKGYEGNFEKFEIPMFSMTGHVESDKILNTLNSKAEKAQTKLFDDFKALETIEKALNLGKRFNATMSAWTAALQTRQIANVMKSVFRNGMTRYNSTTGMFETAKDAKGLQAIFEPLTSQGLMDTWDNFAKGKRAQTLVKQKLGVPWSTVTNEEVKRLTGFTKDEANQWIKDGQANGTVVQSHADYQKHNEQVRDFALQTGLISPQQKAAMDQLLDYVPFFREMDEEGGIQARGKSGIAGQTSGIKEFEGSERKILPLLESIAAQTSRIIDSGMKAVAAQRAIGIMQAAGLAQREPTITQPVSKDLASIQADLSKLGVEFNKLPQSAKDHLTGLLYGPQKQTTATTTDRNVVAIRVNGKNQYYKTSDNALTEALQNISKEQESFLKATLGRGKALQTMMSTSSPGFGAANFVKDTLSTFIQMGDTKHLFRVAKGLYKAGTNAKELKAIEASGSGGSAFYNIDPKTIRDVLKTDSFWKNRLNDKLFIKTAWNAWKQVLHASENANRIAIYDKVIENGGTTAEAAFQAQDTLNFQMHGSSKSMQQLISVIPFLNATMQGQYKIKRSFQNDPQGVALRGGLVVLASLGLAALNHWDREDEDENGNNWYERLSPTDRGMFWHFRVPGSTEIKRIPKPYDIGTLFATIPELLYSSIVDPGDTNRNLKIMAASLAQSLPVGGSTLAGYLNSEGKSPLKRASLALAQNFTGNPFVRIPLELVANKNLFFNSPIVTNERAPAQAQYTEKTSATARAIGDKTGISPQEIDYLTQSIFSGLAPYVNLASDAVAKSAGYEGAMRKDVADYLGAGRFTRDSKTMATRYTPEFYQLKNAVDDAQATLKHMQTEVGYEKTREFAQSKQELLAMDKPIKSAEKALKTFKDQVSKIRLGTGTLEEKRQREDEILVKRNEVLSRTMKTYQDILDRKEKAKK